jgi:hypothetical protein
MLNYVLIGNTLTKSIIAKVHNENLSYKDEIENFSKNCANVFFLICKDLQKYESSNTLEEGGINYFYNIIDNLLIMVLLAKNEEKKFVDFINEVKILQINPDIINNSSDAKINLESELNKLLTKFSKKDLPVTPLTQTENIHNANSEIRVNQETDRSIINLVENKQARRTVKSNNTRLIIIIVFIVIGIILAIILPTVLQSRPKKN